eukprot:superscaffoldBa00003980_g18064
MAISSLRSQRASELAGLLDGVRPPRICPSVTDHRRARSCTSVTAPVREETARARKRTAAGKLSCQLKRISSKPEETMNKLPSSSIF